MPRTIRLAVLPFGLLLAGRPASAQRAAPAGVVHVSATASGPALADTTSRSAPAVIGGALGVAAGIAYAVMKTGSATDSSGDALGYIVLPLFFGVLGFATGLAVGAARGG